MKITSLIQKTIVATAMACLVTTGANAQIARKVSGNLSKSPAVSIEKLAKQTKAAPRFLEVNPSDYGTVEVVMEEDFSKFATGSEEAPDMDATVTLDYAQGECEYPWWNLDPQFTTLPNWGGSNLFPAGGMVYMLESIYDGQTHINTPLLDFTKYDGVCCLEFKAKTKNPKIVQKLSIEAAETNNMGPDWTVIGAQLSPSLSEEWQTFRVIYFGAGKTTLFNVVPQMESWWYESKSEEPCQILIDDFKAFSVIPYVETPKNLSYKNYKGEEFDLTWDAVDADSYTVNVWELDEMTGELYELVLDEPTNTNSYHVTGAEAGYTYVFNVTAVKGDKKSFPSQQGMVFDLVDPEFLQVPEIVPNEETGGFTFTSSWSEVPSAQVYDYSVWHKRMSWYDHEFVVTDEDFTGLLDGDDLPVEWTIDNPSWSCYGQLPIKPMHQPGWIGKSYMPFKDYVCLDGWQHIVAKADAYIASPELDLSKDNGKFHLTVKLFGRIGGWFDPLEQVQHDNIQTKGAASLYNYNEATGQFEQVEYFAFDDVTTAWETFDVDFTKGSARSFVVIEAIEGPDHLYIDDLKITQNYKKGEYLLEPCIYEYWWNYADYDAELPASVAGEEIYEKVCAQKANPMTGAPVFSNTVSQKIGQAGDYPAGIHDASIANKTVSYENGQIVVNNVNGEDVNIYTVDGKLVYSNNSGAANVVVRIAEKGVYMVKVGQKSVKFSI